MNIRRKETNRSVEWFFQEWQSLWRSRHIAPRGNKTLLAIVSVLRLFSTVGIAVRFMIINKDSSFSPYTIALAVYLLFSLLYSLGVFLGQSKYKNLFYSRKMIYLQVYIDIFIYAIGQLLSLDSKSDLYFLNILPLLIVAEFLTFGIGMLTILLLVLVHFSILAIIALQQGLVLTDWLLRDFTPRTFIICIIGCTYLIQRQLRTLPESHITQERQQLSKRLRTLTRDLPLEQQKEVRQLEKSFERYADSIDWYRRLNARAVNSHINDLAREMLEALRIVEKANPENDQDYRWRVGLVMERLGHITKCNAGTLRFESITPEGNKSLELFASFGCEKKQTQKQFQFLSIDKQSLVVRAFRTSKPQKWVKVHSNDPIPLSNLDFAESCQIKALYSIPITVGSKRGVITFYRNVSNAFSHAETTLLETAIDYIAVSLSRIQYLDEIKQQSYQHMKNLILLRKIAVELTKLDTEQNILQYTVKLTKYQFQCEVSSVFMMRGEFLRRKAESGIEQDFFMEEHYSPKESGTGQAYISEGYVLINNVPREKENIKNFEAYVDKLGRFQHILAVPMISQHSRIGVIRLINKLADDADLMEGGFSEEDAELLKAIGSMVAVAIEAIRQAARLKTVLDLAHDTLTCESQERIFSIICTAACKAVNADQSGIVLFNEQRDTGNVAMQIKKITRIGQPALYQIVNPIAYGVIDLLNYEGVQRIIAEQKTLQVTDAQNSPITAAAHTLIKAQDIASFLLLPLTLRGEVVATLGVDSVKNKREFTQQEIAICELIAAFGSMALERILRFESAEIKGKNHERTRIRQDLHDIKGLIGSNIEVDLQNMEKLLRTRNLDELKNGLILSRKKVESIKEQMNRVMDDLLFPILTDEGLSAAIDEHIKNYSPYTKVEFQTTLRRRIDPVVEHELFRITQEALSNAIRHGVSEKEDGEIYIILDDDQTKITLQVSDNGMGFDASKLIDGSLIRHGSLGIINMRHRATNNLRTDLQILSHIGTGTTIQVVVDLTVGYGDEE